MRAWYGMGPYWYVVATPAGKSESIAYGWREDSLTWERIGAQRVDWKADDFGRPMDPAGIPQAIRDALPGRAK